MIESIGNIDDLEKKEIAEGIVNTFNEKYPDIEGEAYYGYPIYIDEITESNDCFCITYITRSIRSICNCTAVVCLVVGEVTIADNTIMAIHIKSTSLVESNVIVK